MVERDTQPDEREFVGNSPSALSQRCLPRRDLRQAEQSNSPLARRERHHQERQVLAASVLRWRGSERSFESIRCRRGATCLGTAHPRLPDDHADRIDGDSLDDIASQASGGLALILSTAVDRDVRFGS